MYPWFLGNTRKKKTKRMGPDMSRPKWVINSWCPEVDFDHCTEIDAAKKKNIAKKSSTKKQTIKNTLQSGAMGPQNKCPPLEPHAHGGLQFYLQLLHLYACQCKPNFDSKAPERLQAHCGPVQGNPHPPNENAPLPHPKNFAFLPKNYMEKTNLHGFMFGICWGYDSTNSISHINTETRCLTTPLGPAPWNEMYECSHLLCPRRAIRDACLKYPQKKTWHKSTSLCCQKESSQDAEKMVFLFAKRSCCETNVAAIMQIEILTRPLGKCMRNKLDGNRNQWKVHSSWARIGMNFRSWWTR